MEEDEDDDIYAPDEGDLPQESSIKNVATSQSMQSGALGSIKAPQDEESGEEIEEDDSDSDIDIITERKEEPKKETAPGPQVSSSRTPAPLRLGSAEPTAARSGSTTVKTETPAKELHLKPGSAYPAVRTSSVDLDAKPMHEPSGKPIMEVDMDADFPGDDKAWRRPGTDMTDYFNYGFDEFTWANYCLKQQTLRKEVSDSKKQMEDMQSFLSGGASGMPGMPGMPGASAGGMPSMPGMGEIPPEMQQMFAQMINSGMDPSQMDPSTAFQMMQGGQGGQGGDQGYGGQGYGQQQHNQQHYGYGGGNQGGGRGRGRRW